VLLDVDGLLPRFGTESALADALLRAGRRVGLDVRVGIAGNPDVARVAARCTADAIVVAAGEERAFAAPLPLELLLPPIDVVLALARWGVASAGELARLPRIEVRLRLGSAGLALHRLACGEPVHEFVPDPLREELREGIALEHAVVALEPFLFLLHGLLSRLAERLALRGEGFADALVELHLEGGGRHELRVKPVAPSPEVPAVLALARLQLEAHPPGGPVDGVTVTVTPGRVRWVQGALFGAPQPAPAKLAMTLARLAALVGPDRVGAPLVPDSHRPGAWALAPFAPTNAGDRGQGTGDRGGAGERTPNPGPRTPVLRAYRPPRPAQVVAIGGRPVTARLNGLGGTVVGWAGPYRSTGDWWTGDPYSRDDFDVATADGTLLRLFFDRLSGRWFVDGIYD
jgi:protein ImuB